LIPTKKEHEEKRKSQIINLLWVDRVSEDSKRAKVVLCSVKDSSKPLSFESYSPHANEADRAGAEH